MELRYISLLLKIFFNGVSFLLCLCFFKEDILLYFIILLWRGKKAGVFVSLSFQVNMALKLDNSVVVWQRGTF